MASKVPNKKWMTAPPLSPTYIEGAQSFIEFTQKRLGKKLDWYCCPCVICRLCQKRTAADVYEHLICNGIDTSYTTWVHHGESFPNKRVKVRKSGTSTGPVQEVRIEEMIHDTFRRSLPSDINACLDEVYDEDDSPVLNDTREDVQSGPQENCLDSQDAAKYKKLIEDALEPIYPLCKDGDSKLSITIALLSMKARSRWSDSSFTELLTFLKKILPNENTLPEKTSSAKAMIKSLRMKCETIQACKNDCILYWEEHADKERCPTCEESRWRPIDASKPNAKRKPWKKLRYFPLTERLQKMYSIPWIAENMKWHANATENQSYMRHPVDSPCWEAVNFRWRDFGKGKGDRNVRLGLATDGFNPYGNKSNSYSCWPVMMVPYNLPPSLCMRKEFVMLTLLIPGPSGPGHDIDVYFQPLIKELKHLWEKGVKTYDSYEKNTFTMKAILLWTIHDFPAYGHVSGCRTSGRYACPVCSEDVDSKWLKNGRKFAYMRCRRFLLAFHRFRTQKAQFNGKEEHGTQPRRLHGSEVLSKMRKIQTAFGKGKKRKSPTGDIGAWSKQSIFFELEYWEFLHVRHNLDVMHVEKNVVENLLATIMDCKKKTVDGLKAGKDLKAVKIKRNAASERSKGKSNKTAPFRLSQSEKEMLCKTLSQLKVPIGYSGNWKHNVDLVKNRFKNLKSHDYHIIMEQLLPVLLMHAFKKHKQLAKAICQLSLFFKVLCSKVVCREELEKMEECVVESLCVFEKYFPPSFFVSMTHLVLHLAEEVLICGPVRYRWMCPFERMMKTYKWYVGNQTFPEGCITEQYLNVEAMRYCMEYIPSNKRGGHMSDVLDNKKSYTLPKSGKAYMLTTLQYQQARKWLLKSSNENAEWEEKYNTYIQEHKSKSRNQRNNQRALEYIPWLRHKFENKEMSAFKRLVDGPSFISKSYTSCETNGYLFKTYDSEVGSTTQNSGVSMKAITKFRSSAKDTHLVENETMYYGVVRMILELDYYEFKEVVFYCDWVRVEDKKNGCVTDSDTRLVFVNLGRWQKNDNECNEPFITSSEASQVFYCKDLSRVDWYVVLDMPKRLNVDMDAYEDPLAFDDHIEEDQYHDI